MLSSGQQDSVDTAPILQQDGGYLPTLLDYFLRRDRKRFFVIVDALRARIPGLRDLNVATPSASERKIELVLENGFTLDGESMSTGVRIIMFFVGLAFHPDPRNSS